MDTNELLDAAKAAEERVIEAQHEAEIARAAFNRTVRRLHLHGTSLREIAAALGISHQRVHQIVEAAGGGRPWRERAAPSGDPKCSFCGAPRPDDGQFVAGPAVGVCRSCIGLAAAVIEAGDAMATDPDGMQRVGDDDPRRRCSFCGKRRSQVAALVGFDPLDAPMICNECVGLAQEILGDRSGPVQYGPPRRSQP